MQSVLAQTTEGENPEDAAGSGLGTSAIGEDFAIPVSPVLVSVIQKRKILGSMTVLLVLNATNIGTYDEVRPHVPRLHDRFLRLMTEFAAKELVFSKPVDVTRVTQLLQAETNGYLQRDDVEVLVYQAQLQRRLVKGR